MKLNFECLKMQNEICRRIVVEGQMEIWGNWSSYHVYFESYGY